MNPTTEELRKIDAKIHQKVFGWTVKSRPCPHSGSVQEHFWYAPGNDIQPDYQCSTQTMFPSGTVVGINCPKDVPNYTTDPAAAFELLKKCAEKLNCNHLSIREREDDFWVIETRGDDGTEFYASEGGFELAIAQFALKLFGGQQ